MSVEVLAAKARIHWQEWLPVKTAELKARGDFQAAAREAAGQAQAEMERLMGLGYGMEQAWEIAVWEFVFLPPENWAALGPWSVLGEKGKEAVYMARIRAVDSCSGAGLAGLRSSPQPGASLSFASPRRSKPGGPGSAPG